MAEVKQAQPEVKEPKAQASFAVRPQALIIRKEASIKSQRVGLLSQGDVVTGTVEGAWVRLESGGYCLKEHLFAAAVKAEPKQDSRVEQ